MGTESMIVNILQDCVFELGIKNSVEDATNLIRLAEEKFKSEINKLEIFEFEIENLDNKFIRFSDLL